ncbi:MAG: hypothetical protein OXC31_06770, partial [Spirochaetaceae bacterium]|nr:hypothetical protein [Spirochaetaceae bacterium]
GDADVLAAWQDDDTIAWYENLSNHGDDHGDAPESTTLATALPAFLHGTVESAGDRDVFRVAAASGTVRVYSNGPTDTFGTLMGADGAELATDDDSGTGPNFRIEVEVATGTRYVEVRGFNTATTGPHTLSIELVVDTSQTTASGSGPGNRTDNAE